MSESQKKEAKRLFEILKEMGIIGMERTYHGSVGKFWIGILNSEEEWIQKITEAIAMYQAEELEARWNGVREK